MKLANEIVNYYLELRGEDNMSKEYYKENQPRLYYPRMLREANQLLDWCDQDLELSIKFLEKTKDDVGSYNPDWRINSGFRKWLEWEHLWKSAENEAKKPKTLDKLLDINDNELVREK